MLSFHFKVNIFVSLLMTGVMFVDWLIQALDIKKSTNIRRFITGLIGGFGMSYSFFYFTNTILALISAH